jgi:hypothetical protein
MIQVLSYIVNIGYSVGKVECSGRVESVDLRNNLRSKFRLLV